MRDISLVDSNFSVKTELCESDIRFYDVNGAPFEVYGVFYENGKFRRLPEKVASAVSEGVKELHANTAGGRICFKTDSRYVAIHAKMPYIGKMPHFALTGSAGFDMYVFDGTQKYAGTFIPSFSIEDGYESILYFDSPQMREITVNFPLYSEVSELYVGLSDTSSVYSPTPYKIELPIVYYGSSITQGGCASRAGCSYESIISRRLGADFVNLGFSGNAKAETEMAEYISDLNMSVFVYDYDHNAPTAEHLQSTHERMFRTIREKNPTLPILIMSRPKLYLTEDEKLRLDIIRATYQNALGNGDTNVYMLDGEELMRMAGDDGTVDGCHPTDLGFASMAQAVGDVLEKILL